MKWGGKPDRPVGIFRCFSSRFLHDLCLGSFYIYVSMPVLLSPRQGRSKRLNSRISDSGTAYGTRPAGKAPD